MPGDSSSSISISDASYLASMSYATYKMVGGVQVIDPITADYT